MTALYTILYILIGLVVAFLVVKGIIEEQAEDNKTHRVLRPSHLFLFLVFGAIWPLILIGFVIFVVGSWVEDDEPLYDFDAKKEKLNEQAIQKIKEQAYAEGYAAKEKEQE